jgi:ABC-2 type transport system permease protein
VRGTPLRAVIAQARVELVLTLRRGESLVVSFLIPVGVLVFFAKVDAVNTDLREPVDFLVPGMLALAVMSTAMVSLGIATGFERRYGVLKRLGATPLSRGGLLAAKTLNVLVIEVVQAAVIVATGAALGWEVTGGVGLAIVLLLLGTVAFAAIGMLVAGTLRAEATLAVTNGLFLVLLFVGGMAYPLRRLPDALETVARALPAAALAESVRDVLAGRAFPWGATGVLLAWRAPRVGGRDGGGGRALLPLGRGLGVLAEDLAELGIELLLRERPVDPRRDRSVPAHEDRLRDRTDAIRLRDALVVVDRKRPVGALLAREAARGERDVAVGDADHLQPIRLGVVVVRRAQHRELISTRCAPGCPEVDDRGPAARLGEAHAATVEAGQGERGCDVVVPRDLG